MSLPVSHDEHGSLIEDRSEIGSLEEGLGQRTWGSMGGRTTPYSAVGLDLSETRLGPGHRLSDTGPWMHDNWLAD
jgi:hypothetical protein